MDINAETIVWALAALAFLPALSVMSGFLMAGVLAVAILSLFYGGRYGLRLYEQQNVGKKAGRLDMNRHLNANDNDSWRRE